MSEWKECRLGDIIKTNQKSINNKYTHSNILYLDTGSITTNRITELQEFEIKNAPSRAKRLVNEEDIIYSTVRPNQLHYGFIKNPQDNLVVSTGFVTITCNKNEIFPKFLYYNLIQDQTTEYLHSIAEASTSAYPSLKPSDIESLDISLPTLPEQKAIAGVLSSLDDKIDLLHRQNKTLEAMAEALFRQLTISNEQIAMSNEDKWMEGNILDFANHYKVSIQPQQNPTIKYFHYSIPAFDNNKNPVEEFGESIQSNKYSVPKNCILFSKLNPHRDKRVWLLLDEVADNSICSTEFQIILPKEEKYLYFLYGWLSLKENYDEISSGVGGTSGSHQRVEPSVIFNFQCPLVNEDVIIRYNAVADSLFRKIMKNQTQIRTLEKLRDTLLPKLMSGEVRVGV